MSFAKFDYSANSNTAGDGILMGHFDTPLTDDEFRTSVPSVFAEGAHASRSRRYGYIPTADVMNALRSEGYRPVYAIESRPRKNKESRRGFTKHMIRFRPERKGSAVLGATPEFLLLNSHDGSSAYKLLYGLFRNICANGLIAGEKFHEIVVQHRNRERIIPDVVDAAFTVVKDSERMLNAAEQMKATRLCLTERKAFAADALKARFDVDKLEDAPLAVEHVLQPRRYGDSGDDLWTTFNVVQENLIRGGLEGTTKNANGAMRMITTRPVHGIDQNVRVNRKLWTLAEDYAHVKVDDDETVKELVG